MKEQLIREDLVGWAFVLVCLVFVFLLCELVLDRLEARAQGRKPATILDGLRWLRGKR